MEFDQAVAELDTLVATLEREDDERALLLLQLIDAVHRPAIELIVHGELDHPVAQAVMSMYDLAELDQRTEAEEALDEIRPYIESHGGGLELIDVVDGVVHVRMHGSCNGCAASAMTLRRGVETKLRERLDWFEEVVAHDPESNGGGEAANGLLQIDDGLLQITDMRRPVFTDAGPLADLPEGAKKTVEADGKSILIVNVDGEPYAFRNLCPAEGGRLPLDGGRVTGSIIVCPWHNCPYDVRSGKRVDDEPGQPSLAIVPVAVQDGVLRVATNVT